MVDSRIVVVSVEMDVEQGFVVGKARGIRRIGGCTFLLLPVGFFA